MDAWITAVKFLISDWLYDLKLMEPTNLIQLYDKWSYHRCRYFIHKDMTLFREVTNPIDT